MHLRQARPRAGQRLPVLAAGEGPVLREHARDGARDVGAVPLDEVAAVDEADVLNDLSLRHVRDGAVPRAASHAPAHGVVEVAVLVVQARVADADQLAFARQAQLPQRMRMRVLVPALRDTCAAGVKR